MAYTTIDNPALFFNTVLYTGANKSITGVNFQPDWVWIKNRSSGTNHHILVDAVRGATKVFYSNVRQAANNKYKCIYFF